MVYIDSSAKPNSPKTLVKHLNFFSSSSPSVLLLAHFYSFLKKDTSSQHGESHLDHFTMATDSTNSQHFVLFKTSEVLPDYNNEQVYQRNRLPTRSYWIPENSVLLNGVWDFNYALSPIEAPEPQESSITGSEIGSFASTPSGISQRSNSLVDETPAEWTKINVPGQWQLQGHGRPQYTNVIYPFPVCPPHIPTENPTGTYRRQFSVPSAWDTNSQLRIRFDGVDSAFHVWLNGFEVGYHQGSRNSSEFDITNFVKKEGQNELFVRVYQWCDGSYIEDQDQWWLSGRRICNAQI